jgi:hypothetical protein
MIFCNNCQHLFEFNSPVCAAKKRLPAPIPFDGMDVYKKRSCKSYEESDLQKRVIAINPSDGILMFLHQVYGVTIDE